MKKLQYLFYAAAFFALGCSSGKSEGEVPAPAPEGPSSEVFSLKVMSFNIRYSNTTDQGEKSWSQRRKPCVDMIKDVNPGVIGMQESRTEQRFDALGACIYQAEYNRVGEMIYEMTAQTMDI